MQIAITPTESESSQTESALPPPLDWQVEMAVPDLPWIANNQTAYATILHRVPDIFAWEEATEEFSAMKMLAQSIALRRLASSFDHIGRHDDGLRKSMQSLFSQLPLSSKLRFATAPETYHQITLLRKRPVESIVFLCNALNGEAAYCGLGPMKLGYVTALGDYYCLESESGTADNGSHAPEIVSAPYLAGIIPIDFASPNTREAQETKDKREYFRYTKEEEGVVYRCLTDTLALIENTNPTAAALVKEFVKVIIPLKPAAGCGSTSQSRFPGRVLLSGVDKFGMAALASAMVHESIHQLLYILEMTGSFVIPDADSDAAQAKSLWTGRDLALHSFIHACFVWYGLANFWVRERQARVFDPKQAQREFDRCIAGFREGNPVDVLGPNSGMIRYDVLKVARTLRARLEPAVAAAA